MMPLKALRLYLLQALQGTISTCGTADLSTVIKPLTTLSDATIEEEGLTWLQDL